MVIYNTALTYEENLKKPPVVENPVKFSGEPKVDLMGTKVYAPIGIPAGPLPNADYIEAAVKLGVCVPTYKTVRTIERACHPFPNCVFLLPECVVEMGGQAVASGEKTDTMTNSFGMPSFAPDIWMPDVARAQKYIDENPGRLLIVSVVGSKTESREALAADYALCANYAKDAGARIIELNLSCPNVGKEGLGSIYQDGELAGEIVRAVRKALGNEIRILIKVGFWSNKRNMEDVVAAAVKAGVNGIVGINTIPMNVYDKDGNQALPGPGRLSSGVCGRGIAPFAEAWLKDVSKLNADNKYGLVIGSSGGIMDAGDFNKRLDGGADFALAATGPMSDPDMFRRFFG